MKKLLLALAILLTLTSSVFALDTLTTNNLVRKGQNIFEITWAPTYAAATATATFSQPLLDKLNDMYLFKVCATSTRSDETSVGITIKTGASATGFDVLGGGFAAKNIYAAECCVDATWPMDGNLLMTLTWTATTGPASVRLIFVKP